jgi:hypothetical protein
MADAMKEVGKREETVLRGRNFSVESSLVV